MRSLILASLRRHGRRYVAAAVATMLGVGFLSAALSVTEAAKKGVGDALVVQYSTADVIVRATSTDVRRDDLRTVLAQDGIDAWTVADAAWFATTWPHSTQPARVQVGEVAADERLRWQDLESGRLPADAGEVVVDARLADEHDIEIGDALTLRRPQGQGLAVEVVGRTESIQSGGYAARIFTVDRPVRAWGVQDRMPPELLIATSDGTDPRALVAAIEGLGLDADALTTDEARTEVRSSLTDDVDMLGLMLNAYAAVALFVSALVIANTFAIVIAQRAKDLALVRCVGGSRRQLFGSMLAEAVALGVVTATVGTVAGIGFAAGVVAALNGTTLPIPMTMTAPTLPGIVIPFVAGVAVTVLAGVGPALRTRSIAPLAALRGERVVGRASVGRTRAVAGALLGVGGVGLLALGIARASLVLGIAGGALAFLAVIAWAPSIAPWAVRLIGQGRRLLPRRLRGGVPADLAVANSVRNPRRTAATVSALLVGVTLISMLSVGAASLSASAGTAIDHNNPVDLAVAADTELDPSVVDEVQAVSGVDRAAVLAGPRVDIGGVAVPVGAIYSADLDVVRYRPLRSALAAGRAVVPLDRMDLLGGRSRGTLTIETADGPREVPAVLAPIEHGPVVVSAEAAADWGGETRTWAMWLRIDSDADPSTVMGDLRGVTRASPDPSTTVDGGYVERSVLDSALDVMLVVASGLLGLAVVIALVGVGNTLSLSVLERTREHALLRALGLTRGQQRLMLAAEAAVIALIATVVGVALGVGFGWAATTTVLGKVTDQSTVLEVPWLRLAAIALVALVAGVAASILPARRASRIPPAAGLAGS